MKDKILYFYWLLNVKIALRQNSLPKPLKRDIFKSFVRCTSLLKKNKMEEVSCEIGPYTFKAPDPAVLQLLLREIMINEQYHIQLDHDAPFIIDCGSNLGFSILYFKLKFPHAKIIGIEANPDTFNYLADNIKQLTDVTVYNRFVADSHGAKVDFYTFGAGDVSASFDQSRGSIRNEVQTISLESLMNNETVDILKVDIEGGEFFIFNNKVNVDYLKKVNNILLEYHHLIDDKMGNSLGEFLSVFEKNNFIYNIEAGKTTKSTPYFQDIFLKMKQQSPR